MTDDNYDLWVSARTARLHAAADDDEPPYRFSGVAVAAGDILHMEDGTPVLFTEEALREAAETQAGEPLTVDHPTDDDGRPVYPPPTDETVGKVRKAGWLDSHQAVGYDATTHDEQIAQGVQAGSYEVSVHPTFELGDRDPATGAYTAENVKFRDLSVVSKGDSPNNTAEWGASQALASFTQSTDIGAELTASADGPDDVDDPQGLVTNAVRGTLRALGLSADDVDAGEASIEIETIGAESPVDPGSSDMNDDTRQQYVKFLTANADFDEESLEAMDDDVLEQTHEIVAEAAASGDGGSTDSNDDPDDDPDDDPSDDPTLGEMTPGEAVDALADGLREQGFVTEDNASDLVEQAQAQASKADKVDEIIAKSDDFDEDDREALMGSADTVIDREHDRVRGELAAQLPGTAGQAAQLTAGAGGDDDHDEYGTGVQEG